MTVVDDQDVTDLRRRFVEELGDEAAADAAVRMVGRWFRHEAAKLHLPAFRGLECAAAIADTYERWAGWFDPCGFSGPPGRRRST